MNKIQLQTIEKVPFITQAQHGVELEIVDTLRPGFLFLLPITEALVQEVKQLGLGKSIIFYGLKEEAWKVCNLQPLGFLPVPVDEAELLQLLSDQRMSFIVRNKDGMNIIPITQINYVNLEMRSLMFHLSSGEEIRSFTIQKSFEKMIGNLKDRPNMLFIPLTLLVNLNQIKVLGEDSITFKNGDICYFPRNKYELIEKKLLENIANSENFWYNNNEE